jgi:uncharacterized protein YlxW (UPF0749 family)
MELMPLLYKNGNLSEAIDVAQALCVKGQANACNLHRDFLAIQIAKDQEAGAESRSAREVAVQEQILATQQQQNALSQERNSISKEGNAISKTGNEIQGRSKTCTSKKWNGVVTTTCD